MNKKQMSEQDTEVMPTEANSPSLTAFREILLFLLMISIVFIIYANTLDGPFLFDDEANIEQNPYIRINSLMSGELKKAEFKSIVFNRPISKISFALNYYFHQFRVFGYHLVNILVHITTGILLFFFVRTTIDVFKVESSKLKAGGPPLVYESLDPLFIAFFTALIWLVHPIQTQSVSYIVQRMNSLAAMFYILSFLLYMKARTSGSRRNRLLLFSGCFLAGLLAFGSKENAATLPFFIFLYEWYFYQDLDWKWLKRNLFVFVILLIFLFIIAFIYLGKNPLEKILAGYGWHDFTMEQRVLTEFRVVIFYLGMLVFPHPSRLNLEHDFLLSFSIIHPVTTILSLLLIMGFIALAVFSAKKNRLFSFCILWFFGNLVIESSVIELDIIFEHRNYLPSMFVVLIFVIIVHQYLKPRGLSIAVLCLVTLIFSFWTHERNRVWADRVAFWTDCVNKSPQKARPHSNLGRILAQEGRVAEGISHLEESLRINPDYAVAHNNLGTVLERQGRREEAVRHYSEAVGITPGFSNAHYNLGVALHRQGKIQDAISHYKKTLEINSGHALAHNNLGVALQSMGRIKQAIDHYSRALEIKPDYKDAQKNLNLALKLKEKP